MPYCSAIVAIGEHPAQEARGWGCIWWGIIVSVAGVDLVDETFIVVQPQVLAGVVADPASWARWWPDLRLTVFMDRGVTGQRWSMTGALVGSLEIWIEPFADGCIVHHYLRGEPSDDGLTPAPWPDTPKGWRAAAKERARRATAWKRTVWELKREVEQQRPAGAAPAWATSHEEGQ